MCTIENGNIVCRSVVVEDIERRFKRVTGIEADLSIFPLSIDNDGFHQQQTTEQEVDEYNFVTTPLHIVDMMVDKTVGTVEEKPWDKGYVDLCCGCGQFSVRILRRIVNLDKSISCHNPPKSEEACLNRFVLDNLLLTELNPESIAKVIYVFNGSVSLMMGDSINVRVGTDYTGLMFWMKLSDGQYDWRKDNEFTKAVLDILSTEARWHNKVRKIQDEVEKRMDKEGNYIYQKYTQQTLF